MRTSDSEQESVRPRGAILFYFNSTFKTCKFPRRQVDPGTNRLKPTAGSLTHQHSHQPQPLPL